MYGTVAYRTGTPLSKIDKGQKLHLPLIFTEILNGTGRYTGRCTVKLTARHVPLLNRPYLIYACN